MRYFKQVLLILVAVSILWPLNYANASAVQDQLKTSIDQILVILKDPALSGDENTEKRRADLKIIINQRFSFAKMSQLSLSKNWKKRTDEEKKAFIVLFGQLLEDTYVSKIEAYTDEKIIYVKEYVNKKKAQISTKIITDTVEIPINYRMYQTKDGSWMVYDLVIEGVSLVSMYRAQFTEILHKKTYEELVEELKKKLD